MTEFGTFKDERDGCVYKTVRIGEQVWFAENFRYDCAGSKVYENDENNLERYGRLYTWRTAMNAAPDGWRLPSLDDWNELTKSVGGEDVEGKVLKSREGWNDSWTGTDELGFGALPGGFGDIQVSKTLFHREGTYASWWARNSGKSNACNLNLGMSALYSEKNSKQMMLSVRYVED